MSFCYCVRRTDVSFLKVFCLRRRVEASGLQEVAKQKGVFFVAGPENGGRRASPAIREQLFL
jgi:hypothetical protein